MCVLCLSTMWVTGFTLRPAGLVTSAITYRVCFAGEEFFLERLLICDPVFLFASGRSHVFRKLSISSRFSSYSSIMILHISLVMFPFCPFDLCGIFFFLFSQALSRQANKSKPWCQERVTPFGVVSQWGTIDS